jgi:alpha-tubulin suppressor-like RCC1 family protein
VLPIPGRRLVLGLLLLGLAAPTASGAGSAGSKPKPETTVMVKAKASPIAGGVDHSLALKSGAVYAWGWNVVGQLGNGSTNGSDVPVRARLPGGTKVIGVSGGFAHTVAVTSSGEVFSWGKNYNSDLANGSTTDSDLPVRSMLPAGTKVVAVAASSDSSFALTSTGAVLGWGLNDQGQLGDGASGNNNVPPGNVSLPAGTTVIAIAAGSLHTLALTSTGAVLAWGYNAQGELGDGNRKNADVPVKVKLPAGAKVTAIAAGGYESLALTSSGAVYAWGYNADGELGDGSTTNSDVPVKVKLSAKVSAIAVGGDANGVGSVHPGPGHSLAATSSGAVYAWGYNADGELGNGTTTNSDKPVKVILSAAVTALAAGQLNSLAATSSGAVYAWGGNDFGQLGDGSYAESKVPVRVRVP